ncbi:MAG: hypothetical protein SGILL_008338 [Bacillariaceae sp.]
MSEATTNNNDNDGREVVLPEEVIVSFPTMKAELTEALTSRGLEALIPRLEQEGVCVAFQLGCKVWHKTLDARVLLEEMGISGRPGRKFRNMCNCLERQYKVWKDCQRKIRRQNVTIAQLTEQVDDLLTQVHDLEGQITFGMRH